MPFPVVALLAAGDDITLCRLASPYNGDYMVHGELGGVKICLAVVTLPPTLQVFPPLRRP